MGGKRPRPRPSKRRTQANAVLKQTPYSSKRRTQAGAALKQTPYSGKRRTQASAVHKQSCKPPSGVILSEAKNLRLLFVRFLCPPVHQHGWATTPPAPRHSPLPLLLTTSSASPYPPTHAAAYPWILVQLVLDTNHVRANWCCSCSRSGSIRRLDRRTPACRSDTDVGLVRSTYHWTWCQTRRPAPAGIPFRIQELPSLSQVAQ